MEVVRKRDELLLLTVYIPTYIHTHILYVYTRLSFKCSAIVFDRQTLDSHFTFSLEMLFHAYILRIQSYYEVENLVNTFYKVLIIKQSVSYICTKKPLSSLPGCHSAVW